MEYRNFITRRNIVAIVAVSLVLLLLYICFDNLVFRVKSFSPSLDKMPDSATELRVHFSQPVKSIGSVALNDTVIKPVIKDKVVIIPIGRALEADSQYSLVLEDIQSKWFDNSIDSINKQFTPEYVPYDKLSTEEKEAQIEQSNSGQVDDAFISNNVFPIYNERWQIDATVNTEDRSAFLNVKFFKEVPNYDNGGEVTRVSNETAEKYRKEVLDEIKKRGGNPSDYLIIYDNPYLSDKYR